MTEHLPKHLHAYNFTVESCPTPEKLQHIFNTYKDKEGFYPYLIPQAHGCILVIATKNPDAFLDTKPRIELGLQPLREHEVKALIKTVSSMPIPKFAEEYIDTFLTLIYEQGYEVCKRVEKEAEK